MTNHGSVTAKLLIAISVLAAVLFGRVVGEKTIGLLTKATSKAEDLRTYPDSAWEPRTMGEITLEAPSAFRPAPDIRTELRPDLQKQMIGYQAWTSDKSTRFIHIDLARLEYSADAIPNLDGITNGINKHIAARLEDAAPKFTVTPRTVDGLTGRKSSYHLLTEHGSVYVDSILIQKGAVIWQVSVLYMSDIYWPIAHRVLESVHVKPAS